MKQFMSLPKLKQGDGVAVISPSSGLAGVFPWVFELGLDRLKTEFGLKPIEYPTTRKPQASLEERARDIMAAFSDPNASAVIAAIGGSDQIRLLKLLDPEILLNNPKPFFGYSDNTHLHHYLWNLGIPSYYGGSIMTQFAMQGSMDDMTKQSIRTALFSDETIQLVAAQKYNDMGLSWADRSNLAKKRLYEENAGWKWDGVRDVSGILWGGCIESLVVQFSVDKYLPADADIEGCVLFIETAEDIPEHWIVEYVLMGMGERGWLDAFEAVLVGRPKAWEYDKPNSQEVKKEYTRNQQATILRTIRHYNKNIPVVQNMDFGHTDPQTIVPLGKKAIIKSSSQTIAFEY